MASGRNTSIKELELSWYSLPSFSTLLLWQKVETSLLINRCRGSPSNTSEEEEFIAGLSKGVKTRFSSILSPVLVSADSTRETLGLGRGPGVKYVAMLMPCSCASERLCVVISPSNKNSEFMNL